MLVVHGWPPPSYHLLRPLTRDSTPASSQPATSVLFTLTGTVRDRHSFLVFPFSSSAFQRVPQGLRRISIHAHCVTRLQVNSWGKLKWLSVWEWVCGGLHTGFSQISVVSLCSLFYAWMSKWNVVSMPKNLRLCFLRSIVNLLLAPGTGINLARTLGWFQMVVCPKIWELRDKPCAVFLVKEWVRGVFFSFDEICSFVLLLCAGGLVRRRRSYWLPFQVLGYAEVVVHCPKSVQLCGMISNRNAVFCMSIMCNVCVKKCAFFCLCCAGGRLVRIRRSRNYWVSCKLLGYAQLVGKCLQVCGG